MVRILVVMLVSVVLCAQDAKPKLPGEDWVPLFNGTDLTGWTKIGKEKWDVVDGVIHGVATTKEYGYLRTEKNYKDFHLALKFKCNGDGNSGVFFHSEFKPGTATITQGLQFEIDCVLGRHTGGIYGDGRQWIVWPAPENEIVVSAEGGRQPLRRPAQRRVDGGLHGSEPSVVRRGHLASASLRRPWRHDVQGHLHPRSDETLARRVSLFDSPQRSGACGLN
jgi:hypothetical protein